MSLDSSPANEAYNPVCGSEYEAALLSTAKATLHRWLASACPSLAKAELRLGNATRLQPNKEVRRPALPDTRM